jgi:inner membrane protein
LNSLPDLDVLPLLLSDDPVVRMTWHRSATHSLLVLPFVAEALWAWFKHRGARVAEAPQRWFWVFQCTLLAHPLLDAFTVYGTQLLWPLPMPPVMWSTLFIIDPALTLPLLVACVMAWFARQRIAAQRALVCGLGLTGAYLGWSLLAKSLVEHQADCALASLGLQHAPRFSVPMPFNTLSWRVVAMTSDGFVEGEYSLLGERPHDRPDARGPMAFRAHRSDVDALVARLLWFNHHFAKAEVVDGRLVLSDLRMGAEPDYTFRFAVAARDGKGWARDSARGSGLVANPADAGADVAAALAAARIAPAMNTGADRADPPLPINDYFRLAGATCGSIRCRLDFRFELAAVD